MNCLDVHIVILTTVYDGTTLELYGLELPKIAYRLGSCHDDRGVSALPEV